MLRLRAPSLCPLRVLLRGIGASADALPRGFYYRVLPHPLQLRCDRGPMTRVGDIPLRRLAALQEQRVELHFPFRSLLAFRKIHR